MFNTEHPTGHLVCEGRLENLDEMAVNAGMVHWQALAPNGALLAL